MNSQLLHVFRNTPFGREIFMHSAFFAGRVGLSLSVYIPRHSQFLIYFERKVVTVDLDRSFLRSPDTAREHAEHVLAGFGVDHAFFEPTRFTASTLPELPVNYGFMCCPRSISDLSSKIGLGYLGPRVRVIIKHAPFPVLIPSPIFREWKSIACFFGGSANSLHALACAHFLRERTGLPLEIFTQGEGPSKEAFEQSVRTAGVQIPVEPGRIGWTYFEGGDFRENLYQVPHDALVVVGAYGHGVARELFFGSKMETIQTLLPNPMVIVGPNYLSE